MSNVDVVISSPVDTYSGYGARSRDFIKALIEARPDWDIKLLSQRWGNTRFGYLDDHIETDLKSRIIPNLSKKPKVWIQISVPNEFQPVGEYSIGVTAGIETTAAAAPWIEGCNRMDLILGSSNHSKDVLNETSYDLTDNKSQQTQTLKNETPIEVLFEGLDTTKYFKDPENTSFDLKEVKESFAFLTVGHWLKGDVGQDRKNIGYTIKAFLEVFKNKEKQPALILKTSKSNASIMDREELLTLINKIKKTVKGRLPSIYLIHGDLSDAQINDLYNSPKIKAMVSFTKGEGFGRPLLEFSTTGKPIIASDWSGHTDFLHKDYSTLVPGKLTEVHESAVVDNMIIKESSWFTPDDGSAGTALKEVFKNYKKFVPLGRKQRRHTLDNFTYEHMVEKLDDIVEKYVPEFPEEAILNIPKLNLPKLKKIDG